MTAKEKQRELIIEIMKSDEESGLYTTRKQTAVDWLFQKLWETPKDKMVWHSILEKAKEMEKEQMNDAYKEGYFVTFPSDIDFNEYYKEFYGRE